MGEAISNEKLANKGIAEQAKGAVKETWGNAKDAAKQVMKYFCSRRVSVATKTQG